MSSKYFERKSCKKYRFKCCRFCTSIVIVDNVESLGTIKRKRIIIIIIIYIYIYILVTNLYNAWEQLLDELQKKNWVEVVSKNAWNLKKKKWYWKK